MDHLEKSDVLRPTAVFSLQDQVSLFTPLETFQCFHLLMPDLF